MAEIFISYASEDRTRVVPLVRALEAHGWSVFWDRQIPAGKTFDEVIEQALAIAKCVIVLWSEKSVNSRWVRAEATEAAERQILIPVLLERVKIPLEFRRIQAADLKSWEGERSAPAFVRLLKDISALARCQSADDATAYEAHKHPKKPILSHGTRLTQTVSLTELPIKSQADKLPKNVEKNRSRRTRGQITSRLKSLLLGTLISIPIIVIFIVSLFSLFMYGAAILAMIFGPKGPSFDPEIVAIFIVSFIGFIGSGIAGRKVERRFLRQHEGSDED